MALGGKSSSSVELQDDAPAPVADTHIIPAGVVARAREAVQNLMQTERAQAVRDTVLSARTGRIVGLATAWTGLGIWATDVPATLGNLLNTLGVSTAIFGSFEAAAQRANARFDLGTKFSEMSNTVGEFVRNTFKRGRTEDLQPTVEEIVRIPSSSNLIVELSDDDNDNDNASFSSSSSSSSSELSSAGNTPVPTRVEDEPEAKQPRTVDGTDGTDDTVHTEQELSADLFEQLEAAHATSNAAPAILLDDAQPQAPELPVDLNLDDLLDIPAPPVVITTPVEDDAAPAAPAVKDNAVPARRTSTRTATRTATRRRGRGH